MTKQMNFQANLISQYRTQLMGAAFLWIFFHHIPSLPFDNPFLAPILFLKDIGFGGADIFIFLSGFGLSFSMQRPDNKISSFYLRRMLRVIPSYWIALTIWVPIFGYDSIMDLFYRYTTVGFWLHKPGTGWLVPSIVMLYALFPFIYKQYESTQRKLTFVIISSIVTVFASYLIISTPLNYLLIFVVRIPVFLIGMHLGYLTVNNVVSISKKWLIVGSSLLLLSFITLIAVTHIYTKAQMANHGAGMYVMIFATLPLCILLSFLISKLMLLRIWPLAIVAKLVNRLLIYCGTYSLEMFMVHMGIMSLGRQYDLFKRHDLLTALNAGKILEHVLYFICTAIVGYLIYRLANYLRKGLTKIFNTA